MEEILKKRNSMQFTETQFIYTFQKQLHSPDLGVCLIIRKLIWVSLYSQRYIDKNTRGCVYSFFLTE